MAEKDAHDYGFHLRIDDETCDKIALEALSEKDDEPERAECNICPATNSVAAHNYVREPSYLA